MNECETDGEAIEFSTEPDCVGFGKNDEEILSEIVCEKKFSMFGEIYENPTAKFKLNPNGYIKNVSDCIIMLPCEFALKPFHLMDLNSIFKIDQKTIDSFKKNNEFFLEHIKLGNIKPCLRRLAGKPTTLVVGVCQKKMLII